MYGDTAVMRRRASALREQAAELRLTADRLVARAEAVDWTGRAAEAMRTRIRERAVQLREVAGLHDEAADSLDLHTAEVDRRKDAIAERRRRAESLVADARARLAAVEQGPGGAPVAPTDHDRVLAGFSAPPPGHRDWLTVELPGL